MEIMDINVFLLRYLLELVCILKTIREHVADRSVPVDVCLVSHSVLPECLFAQIHDFLRGASALDRHLRESENGFTTFEVFSQCACFVSIV